jgi:hypothetical protein
VRLITAHRILIGAAIAFFLFYALYQFRRAWGVGGTPALVQAVVAAGVAVGLVFYYRSLRGWGKPR